MICCLVCEYPCGTMRVYIGVLGVLCEAKDQEKLPPPPTPFVASRQHSQSRENINFPEDEIVGASEGQTGDSGGGKRIPVLTLFSFYAPLKKRKRKSSFALSGLWWCFPYRSHSGFTPGLFASHHLTQECHPHHQPRPSLWGWWRTGECHHHCSGDRTAVILNIWCNECL